MRKIIYMLLGAVMAIGLVACDKDKPKGQIDPDAMLYVNVKKDANMRVAESTLEPIEGDPQEILSPREVVRQAENLVVVQHDTNYGLLAISEYNMKDIENARIILQGDLIIDRHGALISYYPNARDIRIINGKSEVIAYIPQAVVKDAWPKIQKAYNDGDYDKVYDLFKTAYTAIPCTTMQWNKLKEQGLN